MSKSKKIVIGTVIGLLILIAGTYVASYFIAGNQLPAQATVEGVEVGGLSPDEATEHLEAELSPAVNEPITLSAGETSVEIAPAEAGLAADYDATVRNAGGGFSWDPRDIYGTLTGGGPVELVRTVDTEQLQATIESVADEFATPAVDATVAFESGRIVRTEATSAEALDVDDAVTATEAAFLEGKGHVTATLVETPPEVTDAMVDEVVTSFAEPLISGPVTLTYDDESMQIAPGSLAEAASFTVDGDKIVGSLDTAQLFEQTAEAQRSLETKAPKDATFTFTNGAVTVVPSVTGAVLTEEAFAEAVEQAATATGDGRSVPVEMETQEPEFTTQDATSLGTFTVIGQFTTQYPHAAYRNTNLGRAASSVNGTVLMPGEMFSLNETLGARTEANGYVDGYVINQGRLVRESGGGISQAATTLFNAAFFAGYKDVEHKPHSLYFDRYPAGREATVYYGALDLKFENDSKYPAVIQGYINPSSSGKRGSITFKIWSKPTYDKVESTELRRSNYYSGETRTITGEPDCEPQAPIQGFTVNWERLFYKGGEVVKREPFTWTYKAGDRIVCEP